MSHIHEFAVRFPTDDGLIGRECADSQCARYFKIAVESIRDTMFCPYCGASFPKDELWTTDQDRYLEEAIQRETTAIAEREIDEMFKRITRKFKGMSYRSAPRRSSPPPRPPAEKPVDSELTCPTCSARFQVNGIFGYCPGCRTENLLLYDANLAIILQELDRSANKERQLRHSYADLVATFENFCRKEARARGLSHGRFQNLDNTRRLFRDAGHGDMFDGLSDPEKRLIKRVFELRHIHEHNGGVASDRYVREVPEDAALLGKPVPLSVDELVAAAHVVRRILANLVDSRAT